MKKEKGKIVNLDFYQLYLAFVQEVVSRSIQYFSNNGELSEQAGNVQQADFEFEVADYLNDLLDFLLSFTNFRDWIDNRDDSNELPFTEFCLGELYDDIDQ